MGRTRARGNGQGTVFKRPDRGTWCFSVVVGWKEPLTPTSRLRPIRKTVSGFPRKVDALEAMNRFLHGENIATEKATLDDVYHSWYEFYKSRVKEKTMAGYKQAYAHFADLKYRRIATISAAELQGCMDKCPAGKRTHQMMKVTAGLIWGYAVDSGYVQKDITENLYIGKHEQIHREPLSPADIELIKGSIGQLRYTEYIYCLCYLGFRPGEFLEIKKEQVRFEEINNELVYYIVEGKKTTAGINRKVIVPKQIIEIVLNRLWVPGTEYLFPLYLFSRGKKPVLKKLKRMSVNYFEESVFKPIAAELGIVGKVPYSARHSYADKLKHAEGDVRDKAALIGHSDYSFTRQQYQSSPLEDLKTVTDSIE